MKIVISPETYYLMIKSEMSCDFNCYNQKDKPDELMLGGVYELITEDKDYYILKPEPGSKFEFLRILKTYAKPFTEKDALFNFKIGQEVYFTPICTDNDKKTLSIKENTIYKVSRIINHYYVCLLLEDGYESNKVRFCDITPVKE